MTRVEQAPESVSYHEVLDPFSQVVILDTGAQTADLIYWSLVEAGIRPELLPIDLLGNSSLPLLGLRLFITGNQLEVMAKRRMGTSKETFRTGIAAIPGIHIDTNGFKHVIQTLQSNLRYHSALAYDLTTKPPGSTEWE